MTTNKLHSTGLEAQAPFFMKLDQNPFAHALGLEVRFQECYMCELDVSFCFWFQHYDRCAQLSNGKDNDSETDLSIVCSPDNYIPRADDHRKPSFLHNMDPDRDLMHKPATVWQETQESIH